jgi:hypothetical protein
MRGQAWTPDNFYRYIVSGPRRRQGHGLGGVGRERACGLFTVDGNGKSSSVAHADTQ